MASLRDTVKDYQEELGTVSLGWRFGKRDVLGTPNISTLKWAILPLPGGQKPHGRNQTG